MLGLKLNHVSKRGPCLLALPCHEHPMCWDPMDPGKREKALNLNFFPAVKKPGIFSLESWKLTCDQGNWFFEFSLSNKVLLTETQASVCCLFSWNSHTFWVSTRKFWTQWILVSYQLKQRPELTDRYRSLFCTCAQSWDAAATKSNKHGNFEARHIL